MRGSIVAAVFAAVVCHSAARGACAQVVISIEGACPGTLHVRWEGARPNQRAALMFSQNLGRFRLPGGFCEGTETGLGTQGIRVAKFFVTGAEGQGELSGRVTLYACGGYLQMVEYGSPPCPLSNVVQIPE
ncbi:MAG: hypothetical protein KJZ69_01080 [Phycisphaerales bacterium]|nr:hypothetical protein [Phycisphaerales bacterium]